jgi:linoleate 8R-lipoxygenase / 9,12-octadecadienoate 8-hydroperoxide 8R-isomerase
MVLDSSSANGSAAARVIPSGTDHKDENRVLEALRAINPRNIKTVADVALAGVEGEPLDDKQFYMERIIQLTAELPLHDRVSDTLTNKLLSELWFDLEHPPKSYLGSEYSFRQADGSHNNLLWPHVGKAGQPYARSVRATRMQPTARPDPGVVFYAVLARKTFKPHPNRISSVLFYLASLIIHDCFHTSHEEFAISETSSYLDLAPLYGSNADEQKSVRTMQDGRLKPDAFSDKRILGFPPGVSTLVIMFNRFHNHVVENLAKIDENGRFSSIRRGHSGYKGTPDVNGHFPTPEQLYDEALFQTGRLVTTGLYVNIILKDYVRTILNLNRVDTLWNLDPRSDEGKAFFGTKIPEAMGNQSSAEFNLGRSLRNESSRQS